MRLSRLLSSAGVVMLAAASVAVGMVTPAAAGPHVPAASAPAARTQEPPWLNAPASGRAVTGRTHHIDVPRRELPGRRTDAPARSRSMPTPMPSWPGEAHPSFGPGWEGAGDIGVMATHSINPPGIVLPTTDWLFAPTLYPGGLSCIEVSTVYVDGLYVSPFDWCGGGWQDGWLVDAAFQDKYVRSSAYTIKIIQTNAVTNEWKAYLFNHNTIAWDKLYEKAGDHGPPSGGWDVFELRTHYNSATTVGDFCDRTAGYSFSTKDLYFRVGNNLWTPATASNTDRSTDDNPASFGCPGLTLQWDSDAEYTVTNAPLGCSVHPEMHTWGAANFILIVKLFNPNAYNINGWQLKITLNGSQTVTSPANADFSQSGNVVTVTNGSANSTITSSGGFATFALNGTYTGTNSVPASFTLDTGYTPGTCTVV